MLATLIFGRQTQGRIGSIQMQTLTADGKGVNLDCILSENHELSNTVTAFPVETGDTISDHVRADLQTFSMTGFITNSPVVYLDLDFDASAPDGRVQTAIAVLRQLVADGEPVDIDTTIGTYEGFIFTKLSIPRTAATGEAMEFSATFTEVKKVDVVAVKSVADGKRVSGVDKQAIKKVVTGKAVPKKKGGSLASKALDFAKKKAGK